MEVGSYFHSIQNKLVYILVSYVEPISKELHLHVHDAILVAPSIFDNKVQ